MMNTHAIRLDSDLIPLNLSTEADFQSRNCTNEQIILRHVLTYGLGKYWACAICTLLTDSETRSSVMQTQVRRLIEYLKKREAGERIEEEELDFSNVLQGTQQATTPLTVTYVTKNRMNEEQRTKTITDSVFCRATPRIATEAGRQCVRPGEVRL